MRVVFLALVLVTITGVLGWLMGLLWRSLAPDATDELDDMLTKAGLKVSGDALRELRHRAERRRRWGGVGAGVGFGFGLACSFLLGHRLGEARTSMSLASGFVGIRLGQALSAQVSTATTEGSPRASGLQPRGMTDYLRCRDIVAEIICLVCGVTASAVAAAVLTFHSLGEDRTVVWLIVVIALMLALVALLALFCQRRLLATPMLAEGEAGLVANEVALVTGLRDLLGCVAVALFFGCWMLVLSLQLPWWQSGVGLLVAVGVTRLIFDIGPRPDMAPVTRRLASVQTT